MHSLKFTSLKVEIAFSSINKYVSLSLHSNNDIERNNEAEETRELITKYKVELRVDHTF